MLEVNQFPSKGLKVSLGSGRVRIPGFIHVDVDKNSKPDKVMDVCDLKFDAGSVGVLYASHVLEHLVPTGGNRWQFLLGVLKSWRRALSPDGQMFLCVPHMETLSSLLVDQKQLPSVEKSVLDSIYGGATSAHDVHYSGFTFSVLKELLEEAGFCNVSEFQPSVHDESEAVLLGKSVSLNVSASCSKTLRVSSLPLIKGAQFVDYKKVADERLGMIVDLKRISEERLEKLRASQADSQNLREENEKLYDICQERLDLIDRQVADVQELSLRVRFYEAEMKRYREMLRIKAPWSAFFKRLYVWIFGVKIPQ